MEDIMQKNIKSIVFGAKCSNHIQEQRENYCTKIIERNPNNHQQISKCQRKPAIKTKRRKRQKLGNQVNNQNPRIQETPATNLSSFVLGF